MTTCNIVLFGEAEKGVFHAPYFLRDLRQLVTALGNPPPESRGLDFAVQSLMYRHNIIFFRVAEEGFSYDDYLYGIQFLKEQPSNDRSFQCGAICAPGLADNGIVKQITLVCAFYHSVFITTQSDLYDLLTAV